jgi:hypothetical protein
MVMSTIFNESDMVLVLFNFRRYMVKTVRATRKVTICRIELRKIQNEVDVVMWWESSEDCVRMTTRARDLTCFKISNEDIFRVKSRTAVNNKQQ